MCDVLYISILQVSYILLLLIICGFWLPRELNLPTTLDNWEPTVYFIHSSMVKLLILFKEKTNLCEEQQVNKKRPQGPLKP